MTSLAAKQAQLIADLSLVDDPQERLSLVVDQAKQRPKLSDAERIDANRVKGCVSHVWLVCSVREHRGFFRGDADSPLVRGLVVLLCDFFSDAPLAEIAAFETNLIERLGFARTLSPTRTNGLQAVVATIRAFAKAHADR